MENLENETNRIDDDLFIHFKENPFTSNLPNNILQDLMENDIIYNARTGDEFSQHSYSILNENLIGETSLQNYEFIHAEQKLTHDCESLSKENTNQISLNYQPENITNRIENSGNETKFDSLNDFQDIAGYSSQLIMPNDNSNNFDDVLSSSINPDEINIFEVGANVVIGIPDDMRSENTSELSDQLMSIKSENESIFKISENRQNDVIKAAKSLFSKRTRTLFHWLFPNKSKSSLKSNVSDAWDTLPQDEKHFYISQVLGKFGLQRSPLMINPQLGGLNKESNTPPIINNRRKELKNCLETKKSIHDLISNYDDLGSNACSSNRKRLSPSLSEDELEKAKMLKRLREGNELEDEDEELQTELEKYNLTTLLEGESFWGSDISLEL